MVGPSKFNDVAYGPSALCDCSPGISERMPNMPAATTPLRLGFPLFPATTPWTSVHIYIYIYEHLRLQERAMRRVCIPLQRADAIATLLPD